MASHIEEKRESGKKTCITSCRDQWQDHVTPCENCKKSLLPFGCYAPTLNSSHDIKEEFYSRLRRQLTRLPAGNKLLMGDFNVRVGNEFLSWSNVIDRHGVGKINSNDLLLLPFCIEFNLFIINTVMPSSSEFPKI